MLALRGLNRDVYTQIVKEKYKLFSKRDARAFVEDCLSTSVTIGERNYRRIDRVAEAMAVFGIVDKDIHIVLRNTVNQLELTYSSINLSDRLGYINGMNKAAQILAKGWNI